VKNRLGRVKDQARPICQGSSGARQRLPQTRVRTFCTVSRRPAGPLAPPPRRPGRRSRWRAAPAGPTPVGWRERRETFGPPLTGSSHRVQPQGSMLPLPDCPGPSRTRQARLWPQDNRVRETCLVNVHAKTALTEPARPRRWQRSGAGTRVAGPSVSGSGETPGATVTGGT